MRDWWISVEWKGSLRITESNFSQRSIRRRAAAGALGGAIVLALGGWDRQLPNLPESSLSPVEPSALVVLPSEVATDYATGLSGRTEWMGVWHAMCGSRRGGLSSADLTRIAKSHMDEVAREDVRIVDTPANGVAANFNVVFVLAASVPAAALPAFVQAEQYLEASFTDSITVTIDVSYAALASGVLGATTPFYSTKIYKDSRTALINGGDATDTIQLLLPNTTKIGVRYGSAATITQEDRVYWTRANYKSTVGTVTGNDASMQFSSTFTWDYDPTNGMTAGSTSFVDVVIHEVGHALGCVCGAGVWTKDMSSLDLFRFQYTDGTADYNPDTNAEFTARPRLVASNTPNDSHHIDFVTVEYRMSDGSPYQASHLREETPSLGLMDPALGTGVTNYPDYFTTKDFALFDAIGWDR